MKELGFSAGLLPSVTNNRTPLYGSPVFHEIYDEAQRLDVPLTIHGGVSQNLGLDRVASFLEAHMLEHPVGLFLQITNMMFQGVFQEFPKLRMAYLEAGAGWVPFMMDRMEEDYEKFAARLAPQLKNPPSHFFKSGNIFVTMEVEERTAPYIADLVHRLTSSCGPPTSRTNANATNSAATCRTSTRAKIFPMISKEKCSTTTRCDFIASVKVISLQRARQRGTNVKS